LPGRKEDCIGHFRHSVNKSIEIARHILPVSIMKIHTHTHWVTLFELHPVLGGSYIRRYKHQLRNLPVKTVLQYDVEVDLEIRD